MKTAVTIINTVQVSMDDWTSERVTKVFDDNSTLGEIKDWMIKAGNIKNRTRDQIGFVDGQFANVE